MTSILPALPKFAPMTAVLANDPSKPTHGALFGGKGDGFILPRESPTLFTSTVGAGGAVPTLGGVTWTASGFEFATSNEKTLNDGPTARAAIEKALAGLANLGRAVDNSVFDTAEGAANLRSSLTEDEVFVQAYANGSLVSRIVGKDDAEAGIELLGPAFL